MKDRNELIADVIEALENVKKWRPLYEAVLKATGDKEQALLVVKMVERMDRENEIEVKKVS
jgi:hypothetical protein